MSSLILTPKQREASRLMGRYKTVLLEGGTRSGKTVLIIRNMIIRALHYPETWHVALRLRFKHARQSLWVQTLPKVHRMLGFREHVHYELNKSDLTVTYNIKQPNGKILHSVLIVGGLDDKDRVEKILGNEFATIFVNEASQIAFDSIETLMTRLNPPRGVAPRFWIDYNPPSKQHWGYKVFHDRRFPDGRAVPDDDYKWIKINPFDNKENISSTLFDTLKNLSGVKRIRFLEGGYSSDDGSLWKRKWIHYKPAPKDLVRVVVGVDPSGSIDGDEVGIVAAGIDKEKKIYVIAERSLNGSPKEWGDEVADVYDLVKADAVAAEKNFGGDMVEATITKFGEKNINVILVNASRGKAVRAEPISAMYANGNVFHCEQFIALEDELCLAQGTEVSVLQGIKKIENICEGDYVLTRNGFKKVIKAGLTGIKEVYELKVANRVLYLTGNHKVYTQYGYIRADKLNKNSEVLLCRKSQLDCVRNSTIINITKLMTDIINCQGRVVQPVCTEMFGNIITDKLLKDMTYITKMKTGQTTKLKILKVLHEKNIVQNICLAELLFGRKNNTARNQLINGKTKYQKYIYAKTVKKNTVLSGNVLCSVHPNVEKHFIKSIQKKNLLLPVYDLTVEDDNEFFANGILVHNCTWKPGEGQSPNKLDALVWAITELMTGEVKEEPQEEVFENGVDNIWQ